MEVSGRGACAYDFGLLEGNGDPHPFAAAVPVSTKESILRVAEPRPDFTAFAGRARRARRKLYRRHNEELFKTADALVRARMHTCPLGRQTDLLSRLVSTPDPETGELLDAETVRDQILMHLSNGFNGPSITAAWLVYVLATRPDIEKKLIAEIDGITGGDPGYDLQYDDLMTLTYTTQVIKGKRQCMAQEVTFMMLRVVLFEIYRRYRLRLAPGATVAKNTVVTTKPAAVPITRLPREPDGHQRVEVRPEAHAPVVARPRGEPTEIPAASAYRHLVIAYGSNFGANKELAERFAERSDFHGYTSDVMTLNELAASPPRTQPWLLVVMTSTYTSNPPSNATAFKSWLEYTKPGGQTWRNCRYLVWGLATASGTPSSRSPATCTRSCPSSAPHRSRSSRTATWARRYGNACTRTGTPASGPSSSSFPGLGPRRPQPNASPPRGRPRAC